MATSTNDKDANHQAHRTHGHHQQQHQAFVAISAITVVVNDPTDSLSTPERQHVLHPNFVPSPELSPRSKQSQQKQLQSNTRREGPILISFVEAATEVLRLVLPIIAASFLSFGINRTFCMMVVGQTLTVRDI